MTNGATGLPLVGAPLVDIGASGTGRLGGPAGQIRLRLAHTSAPQVATIAIVVAKSTNVRVRLLSIGGRPESELYSYCGIAGTLCALTIPAIR
jgi:hypothetical protein